MGLPASRQHPHAHHLSHLRRRPQPAPPPPEPPAAPEPQDPEPQDPEPVPLDPRQRTCICIATYNIISGRKQRLEAALRAMGFLNVDFGFLLETKLTDGIHTRFSAGYHVEATEAMSRNQGGIAMFYRDSPFFQVESVVKHGPNVISLELVTGRRRFPIVGAYVPPSDTTTLEFIQKAFDRFQERKDVVLMGDLNVDLCRPDGARDEEIANLIATQGLLDMLQHFRQRRHFGSRKTWMRQQEGRTLRSRNDYILGSDRRIFKKVCIRNPRHFASDHLALLGTIQSRTVGENRAYLRGRKAYPLQPPSRGPLSRVDSLFTELKSHVEKPTRESRRATSWISAGTWALIDQHAQARKCEFPDQALTRRLKRSIQSSLAEDRKQRTLKVGLEIEDLLAKKDAKGAWARIKSWYRQAGDRPPKPAREDLNRVSSEYRDLYTKVPSPRGNIPVLVAPSNVLDDPPAPEEIAEAVRRLRRGKSPGPSGMRAEDLKQWLASAGRKENPDTRAWDTLVDLVQHIFREGDLPTEMPWSAMVLLPKGGGDYHGIGLLEIIWKLVTTIIDRRVKEVVPFHDALHGFRAKRGTGTGIIEAKLTLSCWSSIRSHCLRSSWISARLMMRWIESGRWRSWRDTG